MKTKFSKKSIVIILSVFLLFMAAWLFTAKFFNDLGGRVYDPQTEKFYSPSEIKELNKEE